MSKKGKQPSKMTQPSRVPDALFDYSASNDELIQIDPTISSIFTLMGNKLFGKGLAFVVNNKFQDPKDEFNFLTRNYWESFLFRSFNFIMAHGFLVWYEGKLPSGVKVPEVPDFSQLNIQLSYADGSPDGDFYVSWKDENIPHQLRVFHRSLPFRVTPGTQSAPIDRAKELLRMLYLLTENRIIGVARNANPPMILQSDKQKDPSKKDGGADLEIGEEIIEYEDQLLISRGMDEGRAERVRLMQSNPAYQTYENETDNRYRGPIRHWMHAEIGKQRRPESNLLTVPSGMNYAGMAPAYSDADYRTMREALIQDIHQVFGIPSSIIANTGRMNASANAEMHNNTFYDTLQMWWRVYSILMTDVYRHIYGTSSEAIVGKNKRGRQSAQEKILPEEFDSSAKLFGGQSNEDNSGETTVTVYLRSEFVNSPQIVTELYAQKVINFNIFQKLRAMSVGIPEMLIDKSLEEPLKLKASEEMMLADQGQGTAGIMKKPKPASSTTHSGPPTKKQKKNPSRSTPKPQGAGNSEKMKVT